MEIKYPIIIIISIILFIFTLLLNKKRFFKRDNKNKVANTSIIKNTKEYKNLINKYRKVLYFLYVLVFIALISSAILSSRIIEEQTVKNDIYNRDIILCMDVSGSVLDLNGALVESYKEVVKNLKGERFGISIFNTSSYLLVPLTTDYDYINESLDTIGQAIDYYNNYDKYRGKDIDERLKLSQYIYSGTTVGVERGSSLAGDGLASCIYDFPNLEENRSRIIIFSTDNEVYGEEYIDVEGAAEISKSKNITVYALAPKALSQKDLAKLKNAAEITGGKYYYQEDTSTVSNVINEIEQKEKSLLQGPSKTYIIDYPSVPLIITIVSFFILLIIDKVVLSWLLIQ